MTLTILQVAYPLAPVGPGAVGGAEQVLAMLDEAVVRAGARSLVIACEGSRCRGRLIATPRISGPLDEAAQARARRAHREAIERALRAHPVDLVHLHGIDFHGYLPPAGPPALVTLHLPPAWYPPAALRPERPDTWLHCVSATQRGQCPPGTPLLADIPNGVDLDRLRPGPRKRDFVLALGRVCPEKGWHLALRAARRAGTPLVLAGEVFPYEDHQRYFDEAIAPLLDDARRFIGPVAGERKRRLLASARCLVAPSLAPETSSLVAMEALACGTPVVAFPAGALAEVVDHGRTGFLVESEEKMAAAFGRVEALRPGICRREAEARFSAATMTARYLGVYERLARRRPAPSEPVKKSTAVARDARSGQLRVARRGFAADVPSVHRGRNPEDTPGDGHGSRSAAGGRLPHRLSVEASAPEVEPIPLPALEALAPAWAALWERDPRATVFQRPEWLLAWCHHFTPADPWILAVRRAGRLIGLAPLVRYREDGDRVVGLLGGGVSDYLDALAEEGQAEAVGAAVMAYLHAQRAGFDRCDLRQLRSASPLLATPAPTGWSEAVVPDGVCPSLPLPRDREALEARRSPRLRKNLGYCRRRAAREGEVRFERAPARDAPAAFDALARLHGARWQRVGEPGMLADAAVRRFHTAVAPVLAARGLAAFHVLRLDGRPIAVLYVLRAGSRLADYLGGFDPARRHLSPGALLLDAVLDDALATGAEEFDFLRGAEPYKYAWGARDRPLFRRRLAPPTGEAP